MFLKREKRVLAMDRYEQGIVINALNAKRTELLREERPTDAVDDLLLKTIDAPTKKIKCRCDADEAR